MKANSNNGSANEVIQKIMEYLIKLNLRNMAENLDKELARALTEGSSVSEVILRLVETETVLRRESRITRRIRESRLAERKLLEDFDFDFQPTLDKRLILELATMEFVSRKQGVIFAGKSGTGKSHLAKALALCGCKKDIRVLYTTAANMLTTLYASLADNSLQEQLKYYIKPELLVIDELGFDKLEREDARNASLFFKVIEGRYCKASTILTTNIDFESLGSYLGDPVITSAIVDRLIHHAIIIVIDGPSYRLEESKTLNSQKRKKNKADPNE